MKRQLPLRALLTAFSLACALLPPPSAAAAGLEGKRVLAVMSYHQGNPWQDQERAGIESVLGGAQLTFFSLDAKRDEAGAAARAGEAYALYQRLRPDAVIAADDHAQALFVVPFLRGKVATPVVFLGVNNDAGRYGYPAANVTGIVEVKHVRESLGFAQLLVKGLKRVAVLYKDNLSNQYNVEEIRREADTYPVSIVAYHPLRSLAEALALVRAADGGVDAFLALNLTGLTGADGGLVSVTAAMEAISRASAKPIIAVDDYDIEAGALCGVIKTGWEQGETAARMVLELLEGKAPPEVPIVVNRNGKRYVNVTTAARLGIALDSAAVIGTQLVR